MNGEKIASKNLMDIPIRMSFTVVSYSIQYVCYHGSSHNNIPIFSIDPLGYPERKLVLRHQILVDVLLIHFIDTVIFLHKAEKC